jgi:SAM-dependent methyltransferase
VPSQQLQPKTPNCPITGRPAVRLIQKIHPKLLTKLWRHAGRVELGHLLLPAGAIGLWESPCGLAFFHPAIEGDEALYPAVYRNIGADRWLLNDRDGGRAEFGAAAALIRPGERVLDVGCGEGAFRRHIPESIYTGLDPFAPEDRGAHVVRESLEAHAARHAGCYDVVCAFQVLEHTADPLSLARGMARLLRPGGLFIVAVPSWPSPIVEIPNFPSNAPPHHLSWWNVEALQALSAELGLQALVARDLPAQPDHKLIHWLQWLSPVKAKGPYWRHAWSWHASLIFAFLAARIIAPFIPLPPGARSIDCFLAARKPA